LNFWLISVSPPTQIEVAEMETTYFKIGITIERENMPALVELLKQVLRAVQGDDEAKERRLQASRNAIFAGQKPPEDKGLLTNSRQAAKLLGVSDRTLWGMWNAGKMPQPIRIGQVVRFGYEELRAWVNAGGPSQEKWEWPRRDV
jgi:excisionase family DNA binding protein